MTALPLSPTMTHCNGHILLFCDTCRLSKISSPEELLIFGAKGLVERFIRNEVCVLNYSTVLTAPSHKVRVSSGSHIPAELEHERTEAMYQAKHREDELPEELWHEADIAVFIFGGFSLRIGAALQQARDRKKKCMFFAREEAIAMRLIGDLQLHEIAAMQTVQSMNSITGDVICQIHKGKESQE